MKKLFYILIGLVLIPVALGAQGTLSLKQINDDLHTNYSTSATIASDYATTASVALKADTTYVNATDENIINVRLPLKADLTYVNATDEAIMLDDDSQDVQIEANRVAIGLKASQIDMDSAESAINSLNIDMDSAEAKINELDIQGDSTELGLDAHIDNVSNPHQVTATQTSYVDTYLMDVIDIQAAIDTMSVWLSSIDVINDSQDVAINSLDIKVDSAEVAINLNNIDDDSQDVQIEANRINIDLKADSEEIHTDIAQAYVNVKEFGAVGDGVTDDYTAINNAITSISTTGGTVLFPAGSYLINTQLYLNGKDGIKFKGVGSSDIAASRIIAKGFDGYHFYLVDCIGIQFEDLVLVGDTQSSANSVGGIFLNRSGNTNNPYHSFKNIYIDEISNNGISISAPIMTSFTNVTVHKCVGSSFNFWGGTSVSMNSCYANNSTEAGYLFTSMTYCSLTACGTEVNGVGYYFDNSKSISLMGCGTEDIIYRNSTYNGYAYRSINGSNAITLYDCYDRNSVAGTFSEVAGGLLDYINHKTDTNAQITKIHSLPASSSVYTDTYLLTATDVQSAIDTIAVWLTSIDVTDDSQDVAINAHLINTIGAHAATAISATWTNVQVSLDSIEAAIQNINVGSGFATTAQVSQEVLVHNADANAHATKFADYYTAAVTNATIEAAIAAIPETDLSNYYNKAQTESTVAVMINDNAQAKYWYPANMANGDFTGEVTIEEVAASQTVYNAVYLSSSGWAAAQANADSSLPALGMALETGTGAKKILLRGYVRNTSWSFTKGNLIYVSTSSAGAITATKPSTSGNRIHIIGIAVSTDIIFFCPTNIFWEI